MKKIYYFLLVMSLCFLFVSCGNSFPNDSTEIIMPDDYDSYIGNQWDVESLVAHFIELGFVDVETIPREPNTQNYEKNIFSIDILYNGWETGDAWLAGDVLHSVDTLKIYYNAHPLLTVENCLELYTYLTTKEIDCVEFAEKYDGHYVELDAFVAYYSTFAGTNPIINVAIGDYDGTIELGHGDNSLLDISYVRIGDNTWMPQIDYSVKEGENVKVIGYIMSNKTAYYKELYVETIILEKR